MFKSRFFCGGSALAVTLALTMGANPVFAQETAAAAAAAEDELTRCLEAAGENDAARDACYKAADDVTEVEQIISTGTLIRGTAEDTALPVEVMTREELQERGSPTVNDLIRSLSEVGATQGENNRGATGYGNVSVNLRGLGSGRTLAIMNGRRLADSPIEAGVTNGNFQDLSGVPSAALQQVEVLKDGGTTTYGADAVAGVVNFITRRDLDGFEVNLSHRIIEDSDGDWDNSILWGKRGDSGNVLLSLSWQRRSALAVNDREYLAGFPYLGDRTGISGAAQWVSSSSPGAYIAQVPLPAPTADANADGMPDNGVQQIGDLRQCHTDPNGEGVYPGPTTFQGQRFANMMIGGFQCGRTLSLTSNRSPNTSVIPGTLFRGTATANDNVWPTSYGLTSSASAGQFRDPLCDELGGFRGFGSAAQPACFMHRMSFEDLVNPMDNWVGFGDVNFDITDSIRYHTEFNVQWRVVDVRMAPSDSPSQFWCQPDPFGGPCLGNSQAGYFVPGYNPATVDFLGRFSNLAETERVFTAPQYYALTGITPGTPLPTLIGAPTSYTIDGPIGLRPETGDPWVGGRMLLPNGYWRPFGVGGNPAFRDGQESQTNELMSARMTQQLRIDFGEVFGNTVDLDLSGTYTRVANVQKGKGILVDRLRRALAGFATNLDDPDGDTCTALETSAVHADDDSIVVPYVFGAGGGAGDAPRGFDAGAAAGNGCYFFNPFGTAIRENLWQDFTNDLANVGTNTMGFVGGPQSGGDNPDYQGYAPGYGLANAPGIARWLYEDRETKVLSDNVLLQSILNGELNTFELPGGPIGWAAGAEYRFVRREREYDRLSDDSANPCPFRTSTADPVLQPGIRGTEADDLLTRYDSTCSGTSGVWMDSFGSVESDRRTRTTAYFGELSLPVLDRLTLSVAHRWEKETINGRDNLAEGVGVTSGSMRWRVTDNFSLRASASETFDPSIVPDESVTVTIGDNIWGTAVTVPDSGDPDNPIPGPNTNTRVAAFANTNLGPESGFNWNAGLIWQTPDRRLLVTLDYFNVEVTGEAETITSLDLLRALYNRPTGSIASNEVIDCSSVAAQQFFGQEQTTLGDRPVFAYLAPGGDALDPNFGCRPNTTLAGDADGNALSIAYLTQINAGTTNAQGVDGSVTYSHPDEVLGGLWRVRLDATYNLVNLNGETQFFGVQIDPVLDRLGLQTGLSYNTWRGGLDVSYRRGNHLLAVQTRGASSLRTAPPTVTPFTLGSIPRNYNPSAELRELCAANLLPTQPIGSNPDALGQAGVGEGNYNANCNVPAMAFGQKYIFNTDVTYRLEFPERQASISLTVNNLFDEVPPHYGAAPGYDTSGPLNALGRNFRINVSKQF